MVVLPLPLTIIKHAKELDGKSTAVHAKLLASSQTEIILYDPKNENKTIDGIPTDECLLLFPSAQAKTVDQIHDWTCIKRLIVIDGTWQQAKAMLNSQPFSHLSGRTVKLGKPYETLFWRYQSLGPHCLSTIEAIYRFYQELARLENGYFDSELKQLDNLLFFFSFQFGLVQQDYAQNPQRHFTSKHRPGYIISRTK